jgi:hypothetical protein
METPSPWVVNQLCSPLQEIEAPENGAAVEPKRNQKNQWVV